MAVGERRIERVRPDAFNVSDEELDERILTALDRYGVDLTKGGAAPTTTLVTLAVTTAIVEDRRGPEVVADGVAVEVRRVGTRLALLEREGRVHRVKLATKELRWWHIDRWNERQERERTREVEREDKQAAFRAYRHRWGQVGFTPQDVDDSEVTFSRAVADELLDLVEEVTKAGGV